MPPEMKRACDPGWSGKPSVRQRAHLDTESAMPVMAISVAAGLHQLQRRAVDRRQDRALTAAARCWRFCGHPLLRLRMLVAVRLHQFETSRREHGRQLFDPKRGHDDRCCRWKRCRRRDRLHRHRGGNSGNRRSNRHARFGRGLLRRCGHRNGRADVSRRDNRGGGRGGRLAHGLGRLLGHRCCVCRGRLGGRRRGVIIVVGVVGVRGCAVCGLTSGCRTGITTCATTTAPTSAPAAALFAALVGRGCFARCRGCRGVGCRCRLD